MKRITLISALILFSSLVLFGQSRNTKVFTIFSSPGCGCTGSGGAPQNFTTHEEVIADLEQECYGIDFFVWEGNVTDAYNEVQSNLDSYDGVMIVGRLV